MQHPPHQQTKVSIIAKKATAFATAVAPLASSGTRNVIGIAPPPRHCRSAVTRADLCEGGGEGGGGKAIFAKAINLPCMGHHCLPGGRERRAATICSPAAPLPPAPLAPCRSRANHVPREGSPLAMKQSIRTARALSGSGVCHHLLLYNSVNPANPPIFLFARLIFQSRSYKFLTPNFLLSKKVVITTLCTTGGAQLPPKYPVFFEGVLELLSRDILCPSWKYDNGHIFKTTP